MNPDEVFALPTKSAVGMTVLAQMALLARFAGPGQRARRLTIQRE